MREGVTNQENISRMSIQNKPTHQKYRARFSVSAEPLARGWWIEVGDFPDPYYLCLDSHCAISNRESRAFFSYKS